VVIELSRYVLEALRRKDEDFVLYRSQLDADLSAILVVAPLSERPVPGILEGLSTNLLFGMSLIQSGRLDLSALFVVRVGRCLYSRTLAASHSIGSWDNRWN
jgi:hypothetical protein